MFSHHESGVVTTRCLPLPASRLLRWLVVASYMMLLWYLGHDAAGVLRAVVVVGFTAAEISQTLVTSDTGSRWRSRAGVVVAVCTVRWPARPQPSTV